MDRQGLLVTAALVALALIPFTLVNWLFRRFDKTLESRTFWCCSVALGVGAAATSLGVALLAVGPTDPRNPGPPRYRQGFEWSPGPAEPER